MPAVFWLIVLDVVNFALIQGDLDILALFQEHVSERSDSSIEVSLNY